MEKKLKSSNPWLDFVKLGLLTVASFFGAIVLVEGARWLFGG